MKTKKTNPIAELILCVLFGWLGAHRFYAKKKWAKLYLFTLGLMGIGWMIDTVILLVGVINSRKPVQANPAPVYQQHNPAPMIAKQPHSSIEPDPNVKTYRVTGINYRQDAIMRLASENYDYDKSKKELIADGQVNERVWRYDFLVSKAELVPEPENPHDKNAIKVVVDGEHVGYIKAGSCAHLLKVIREGRVQKIDCTIGGGPYKYIEEDCDSETGKDIYTVEKDSAAYFVTLHVKEG